MLARVTSCALTGIDGFGIIVEADSGGGMPVFEIVGLPDAAVKESRERIRSAVVNSGMEFPYMHTTVNLAPADVRKEGPAYDLPIALALLASAGMLPAAALDGMAVFGELSLDGSVRPVCGALPMVIAARERGVRRFVIPAGNAKECACIEDVELLPAATLGQVAAHLRGSAPIEPAPHERFAARRPSERMGETDLCHVRGQHAAKRALEIAVSGGHNILMIGAPGSGKTMLARCLPGIMPEMTFEEALEVTKIHSVAGLLDKEAGFVSERPFRAPHHTASSASIIGGGRSAMPGEISRAHNGVLFFDELPEFQRGVLEAMRQPMEDGSVMVTRVNAQVRYPARFMLVCAMNPCPCGNLGSRERECRCTPRAVERYLSRISGPLLDRIDMHIEVESIPVREMTMPAAPEETSAQVRARVGAARRIQQERYAGQGIYCNAQLGARQIERYCATTPEARQIIELACERMKLSTRGYTRMLKVARTIADMAGLDVIGADQVAEAVQYRSLDGKYWG